LQDEALAAKEAALEATGKFGGKGYAGLGAEEGALLCDVFPARADLENLDIARHGGGESDLRASVPGRVGGHEEAFTGEHPAQGLAEAALHIGFHVDAVAHPGKAAALGINAFPHLQLHGYGGQLLAPNLIAHTSYLLVLIFLM
jgi:hypothetical protein